MKASIPYCHSAIVDDAPETAEEQVRGEVEKEGFGILTEINVQDTLKKKLDVDFRPYKILGVCNPSAAYQALQVEVKIGAMLPCNVLLRRRDDGRTEVAAVDPVASMQAVHNEKLRPICGAHSRAVAYRDRPALRPQ